MGINEELAKLEDDLRNRYVRHLAAAANVENPEQIEDAANHLAEAAAELRRLGRFFTSAGELKAITAELDHPPTEAVRILPPGEQRILEDRRTIIQGPREPEVEIVPRGQQPPDRRFGSVQAAVAIELLRFTEDGNLAISDLEEVSEWVKKNKPKSFYLISSAGGIEQYVQSIVKKLIYLYKRPDAPPASKEVEDLIARTPQLKNLSIQQIGKLILREPLEEVPGEQQEVQQESQEDELRWLESDKITLARMLNGRSAATLQRILGEITISDITGIGKIIPNDARGRPITQTETDRILRLMEEFFKDKPATLERYTANDNLLFLLNLFANIGDLETAKGLLLKDRLIN